MTEQPGVLHTQMAYAHFHLLPLPGAGTEVAWFLIRAFLRKSDNRGTRTGASRPFHFAKVLARANCCAIRLLAKQKLATASPCPAPRNGRFLAKMDQNSRYNKGDSFGDNGTVAMQKNESEGLAPGTGQTPYAHFAYEI